MIAQAVSNVDRMAAISIFCLKPDGPISATSRRICWKRDLLNNQPLLRTSSKRIGFSPRKCAIAQRFRTATKVQLYPSDRRYPGVFLESLR